MNLIEERENTSDVISQEDFSHLDMQSIPKHVAIIPDGNRRWARKNKILPEKGHKIGAKVLLNTIEASYRLGIKVLTFYIFSTENWKRPKREIKAQLWLLEKSLLEQRSYMIENGVRFLSIGDLTKFPKKIIDIIEETKETTKHCDKIKVVFAMNYGGRDEIARAFQKMLKDYDNKVFEQKDVTENLISDYLDTANLPDPDLLIRTSGESRISNFLLWQISYSELLLSPVFWPEFTPKHLAMAIFDYQQREKRRGS